MTIQPNAQRNQPCCTHQMRLQVFFVFLFVLRSIFRNFASKIVCENESYASIKIFAPFGDGARYR